MHDWQEQAVVTALRPGTAHHHLSPFPTMFYHVSFFALCILVFIRALGNIQGILPWQ
jgi:hypothetical protein